MLPYRMYQQLPGPCAKSAKSFILMIWWFEEQVVSHSDYCLYLEYLESDTQLDNNAVVQSIIVPNTSPPHGIDPSFSPLQCNALRSTLLHETHSSRHRMCTRVSQLYLSLWSVPLFLRSPLLRNQIKKQNALL